ncbi:helix-turn-helix domain-containing protein [Sphaerisporangium sp. NBC_01403]|uniref:helix-turn-helix transcriptional regulator n=1 Tax=Sphaerisporangium sp. NBC_01403 TaxID=2903599 RepID=UPI00324F452F
MRKRDELMTVPDILEELGGISVRTFYRWREIDKAPRSFKLPNGEIRVYRSDFEAWIESLREAA